MRNSLLAGAETGEPVRVGSEEESLYVTPDKYIAMNLHAHTNRSDGDVTIRQVAELARKNRVNIGVTDHNLPPEYEGSWPAGLIPGIEVFTREGVDVVVWGTLKRIQEMFDADIRPHLHRKSPRYCPTKLSIFDVLDIAQYRDLAHIANVEGLLQLRPELWKEVLRHPVGKSFIEVNALMTRSQNAKAVAIADEYGIPVIYTSDAHKFEEQYAGTYTEVPAEHVRDTKKPLLENILDAAYENPAALRHQLTQPTLSQHVQIAAHIAKENGVRAMSLFLWKNVLRFFGWSAVSVYGKMQSSIRKRGLRRGALQS